MLANPGNSQVARVAAGLQIKNSLTSKDPDIKAQYQQRWLAIDANARREVKNYVSNFISFWSCQPLGIRNLTVHPPTHPILSSWTPYKKHLGQFFGHLHGIEVMV